MSEIRSFSVNDQPEVEVLWEGVWCFGLLAEWKRSDDGRWEGTVRFNVRPGENRIGSFDEDLIRPAPAEPLERSLVSDDGEAHS